MSPKFASGKYLANAKFDKQDFSPCPKVAFGKDSQYKFSNMFIIKYSGSFS